MGDHLRLQDGGFSIVLLAGWMLASVASMSDVRDHWESVWTRVSPDQTSWFQLDAEL